MFLFIFSFNLHYSVKVKWGKEVFNDVEANTDEEPTLFKAQLFALTGVQNDRQKVMVKGVTLKDDAWGTMQIKDVKPLVQLLFMVSYNRLISYCIS